MKKNQKEKAGRTVLITTNQKRLMETYIKYNIKKRQIVQYINRDTRFKNHLIKELRNMLEKTLKVYMEYSTTNTLNQDDIDILSYRIFETIGNPCYLNSDMYQF